MSIKVINAILLIATVIGAVFAFRASQEQRQLLAEKARLEAKVGRLVVGDPSRPHFRAVPTGEEMHFQWRVYVPPGMEVWWEQGVGGCGDVSWNSGAVEFIARVRVRENEQGELDVFSSSEQHLSGCGSRLGDRKLADLLRGRWDQIQVEQLGAEGVAVTEVDEVATMLRLTLPDELKRESKLVLDEHMWKRIEENLFTLRFGSPRAFQDAEAKGQSDGP